MSAIAILLTDGESINEQILIKSFNYLKKSKIKKIFFIGDKKIFTKIYKKSKSKKISFIDISLKNSNYFKYLNSITDLSIEMLQNKKINVIINMPLNKKKFLKNKFDGYTEFFSSKLNQLGQENMLLYNKNFSVLPLTTHLKLKDVSKQIKKVKINRAIINVYNFFKKIIKKKISIKVLGLNPHAGIDLNNSEEKKFIVPILAKLKKKISNLEGPISADTAFIKNNKNTIFVGMYHDQVLPVFKAICKFDGINITIGLKYLRLSPDHGVGRNISKNNLINNKSFLNCIKFCEKFI